MLEGHLYLDETEGGFLPPTIEIGLLDLAKEIMGWMGVEKWQPGPVYNQARPYSLGGGVGLDAKVRLTIEVIDD